MLPKFSHVRPKTLREALGILDGREVRIYGGGTDLLGCLRDRVFTTDTIVSLGAIDGLRGISEAADGGLRIGAMTTIADIAGNAGIAERYSALSSAAAVVASPQLRNQGTIGGNLCQKPRCWYYRGDFHCLRKGGELCYAFGGENQFHCIFGGDMCYIVHPSDLAPALAALGAVCRVSSPSSSRSVAVENLHVLPSVDPQRETVLDADEVITEIVLPRPAAGLRSSYRKVRARASWDFALAGVALALVLDGNTVTSARVFLSGAAPVPWRSRAVETAITGTTLDAAAVAAASAAVVEGADPLAENGYKLELFKGLLTEQLTRILRV
jgi:xanthine dehydrogenase YagS FAD-binding subunit